MLIGTGPIGSESGASTQITAVISAIATKV
mgnify:FL=1